MSQGSPEVSRKVMDLPGLWKRKSGWQDSKYSSIQPSDFRPHWVQATRELQDSGKCSPHSCVMKGLALFTSNFKKLFKGTN